MWRCHLHSSLKGDFSAQSSIMVHYRTVISSMTVTAYCWTDTLQPKFSFGDSCCTYRVFWVQTGPVHHQQFDHLEPVYSHRVVHRRVSVLRSDGKPSDPRGRLVTELWLNSYSVFGVDICSTVDEMLGTLTMPRPHGHMEGGAVQLSTTEQKQVFVRESSPATRWSTGVDGGEDRPCLWTWTSLRGRGAAVERVGCRPCRPSGPPWPPAAAHTHGPLDSAHVHTRARWRALTSHLVSFLDGSSGLQELRHHVQVSFEGGFVQSRSLELEKYI